MIVNNKNKAVELFEPTCSGYMAEFTSGSQKETGAMQTYSQMIDKDILFTEGVQNDTLSGAF